MKHGIVEAVRNNRLPHALLLTGPDGVGKLPLATAIAQYVNCLEPTETDSCGKCSNCLKIAKTIHPDVHYVMPIISKTEGGKQLLTADFFEGFREKFVEEPYTSFAAWQRILDGDNKQLMISVGEIRELKRKAFLKAFEAKYKVFIVWNADRINVQGANAFLKVLEEPPERTLFLLTCSEPSRLLTTIQSRCQRIGLGRIPAAEIGAYLTAHKHATSDHAAEVAAVAEGSLAAACDFLQESSGDMYNQYAEWLRSVYSGNFVKITAAVEPIQSAGKEAQRMFLAYSVKKLRDSLLVGIGAEQLAVATSREMEFHRNFGKLLTPEKAERMVALIDESSRFVAGNASASMTFSVLSLKLHTILRSA